MMKMFKVKIDVEATVEAYCEEQIKDALPLGIRKMLEEKFGYIPSCTHEILSIVEVVDDPAEETDTATDRK